MSCTTNLKRLLICTILVFCSSSAVFSKKTSQPIRVKQLINSDWLYYESPIKSIQEFNNNAYENSTLVSLPHTWNAIDAVDQVPGYRRSSSWYEKELVIRDVNSKHHFLYFESVNSYCEIFINHQYVTKHIGGYLGFEVDISNFIPKNGKVKIQLFVSNEINPDIIPSQKADFIIYGGIPRDVWLISTAKNFIKSNFKINTSVSASKATIAVDFSIESTINNSKKISNEITVNLIDPSNELIFSSTKKIEFYTFKNEIVQLPELVNPILWSPSFPNLYTICIKLYNKGILIDSITERIGLRWFEFKEHDAFYLNGSRLLLRGTHRHEEYAGLGNALPDSLHRKDMKMIKEMGANFVRLAHYPQDPEVYKLCDELGLLVWDEIPWCRGGMGGEQWKTNTRNMLNDMIVQNYNHPSIIMWSLGNEIDWLPDNEVYSKTDSINKFLTELNTLAHLLDSGRVTCIRKYYSGSTIVDVFSPSIWAGWYVGSFFDYEKIIVAAQKKYKRFIHAEYGGDSHLGRHSVIDKELRIQNNQDGEEKAVQTAVLNYAAKGDWSESYINKLFDWHLKISEANDSLTGTIQWAFKDFATPLRPENPIPYINQKGVVDRAGNPKDGYYIFKSYWTTKPEFCYIESHTRTRRIGKEDSAEEINVYSNCEQAELIVNGISQGVKDQVEIYSLQMVFHGKFI